MAELGVDATGKQPPPLPVPGRKLGLAEAGAFLNALDRGAASKSARAAKRAEKKRQKAARLGRPFQPRAAQRLAKQQRVASASSKVQRKSALKQKRALKARARLARRERKRAIKATQPRTRARSIRAQYHAEKKTHNLLWLAKLARRLLKKKSIDGRNHGFTGVRSGKGLTGLAGRR